MPTVIVRGRPAWIAAIVLGVGLLVAGLATSQTPLLVGGAAFAAFGLVFLILSLATGGATD